MEIIIHGKPLDASERFTTGIDQTLARKVISDYFAFGSLKEPEALVVEARYWQRTWTSVYTLLLSQTVKDKAGRGSYFAISLVVPQRYCLLVSEVYYLLEKVVNENVLGVYLNSNLQYIVPNFENAAAFEKLCAKLQSAYTNQEKEYDTRFQPQAAFGTDTYCSIQDCDSLAFIQLLRDKGRIIVTEKAETKDALAAQGAKFKQATQRAQTELQEQVQKVTELEKRISQMTDAAREASNKSSGKVKSLEEQIVMLKKEKEQLSQKKADSENALEQLRDKTIQAVKLLGVTENQTKSHDSPNAIFNTKRSKKSIDYMGYLPVANTVLVLFIAIGLLLNFKGCSHDEKMMQELDTAKTQVFSLKEQLSQKDEEITSLRDNNEALQQTLMQYRTELEQLQERMRPLAPFNSPSQTKQTSKKEAKTNSGKEVKKDSKKESDSKTESNKKETKK